MRQINKIEFDHIMSSKRFTQRRRIAWIMIILCVIITIWLFMIVPAANVQHYVGLYGTLMALVGAIIGYYFGAATYDHTKMIDKTPLIKDDDESGN